MPKRIHFACCGDVIDSKPPFPYPGYYPPSLPLRPRLNDRDGDRGEVGQLGDQSDGSHAHHQRDVGVAVDERVAALLAVDGETELRGDIGRRGVLDVADARGRNDFARADGGNRGVSELLAGGGVETLADAHRDLPGGPG